MEAANAAKSMATERRKLSAVVTKTKSLPVSATTFPTALSLYSAHDGRKHKHNPTISANKHVVQICRSSLLAAADGLQTVQVSVEPRLSTALKDRSAVPYSSPKDSARLRYMYHVSNSVVFVHHAGTLAKGYPLSKLFSKAEPVLFEKEININLVYSCLKHANEMLLRDPRKADQRTQSFHFPIVIHQSLNPAPRSSAQAPSSTSSHELRALNWLRMRRRIGSTRRRGNHMHDHTRFQRDIDDVTGVSLSLSLSLSLY